MDKLYVNSWIVVLLAFTLMCRCERQLEGVADDAETCESGENGEECKHADDRKNNRYSRLDNFKLTRLQPGGNDTFVFQDGTEVVVKTFNRDKPSIFVIENFLSGEECDYFISNAKEMGLVHSQTTETGNLPSSRFVLMDVDRDGNLTVDELRLTIENSFDVYMDNEDVQKFIDEYDQDPDGDGIITRKELTVTPNVIEQFLKGFLRKSPEMHSRYSSQVWLYPDTSNDNMFKSLQNKVSMVTGLPEELIGISDFQVVNYGVKGHYNAHHDSSELKKSMPCCTRKRVMNCRLCRYMTVLFYLNDVEEGGATAFPIANNETYDYSLLRIKQLVNLRSKCRESRVKVEPSKGKAVIWYNHMIDENGWLGEMDKYTLHGGCPVAMGEKWIANFWIKVTDDRHADINRMKKMK